MKLTRLAPLALGGVLLAGGFAGASLAQQPPLAVMAQGAAQAGQPAGPREGRRMDPEAMAAKHAERLRAVLQLRPEQEPALKAYLAARKPAGMAGRRGGREQSAAMTTPQRLDAQRARLTERVARFDQRAAATKTFYAQLSPSQQKAFDALGSRGGKGGHRGWGGRGHGHGG
jgi:hypothetical protein